MKKVTFLMALAITIFSPKSLEAQSTDLTGTPIGRIFSDYRYSVNNLNNYQGFGVSRAWLGYKYHIDKYFSAQVIIDIGSPMATDDLSAKRYSYLRNALISYRKNNLTVTVGMTDTRTATAELKLWGKRYISRPFLLNYKFVEVADLGIVLDYKISDNLTLDAAIVNGEGYTNIQSDSKLLYGIGATLNSDNGLIVRVYTDIYSRDYETKNTYAFTAGYMHKYFTIGSGYNIKTSFDWTEGHNSNGFSIFSSLNISPKFELFGRYDQLESSIVQGDTDPWNISNDGSLIVAGVQFKLRKQLKVSLNYQGWNPAGSNYNSWDYLQANAEFRF